MDQMACIKKIKPQMAKAQPAGVTRVWYFPDTSPLSGRFIRDGTPLTNPTLAIYATKLRTFRAAMLSLRVDDDDDGSEDDMLLLLLLLLILLLLCLWSVRKGKVQFVRQRKLALFSI